jgi:hypothetical protein
MRPHGRNIEKPAPLSSSGLRKKACQQLCCVGRLPKKHPEFGRCFNEWLMALVTVNNSPPCHDGLSAKSKVSPRERASNFSLEHADRGQLTNRGRSPFNEVKEAF